ncbi:MAG: class I SAM-dependent methyltransferase [Chitinophagales bacterium]|nr:class I SAM-dependent methyltransferase [Chitinophagales bacterium]MDW8418920.1 class I SAM-dependent methyltransferase [Chitinophagales bacterium]
MTLYVILILLILLQAGIIAFLIWQSRSDTKLMKSVSETTPESVRKFYNETTDKFLQVYGEIIQAFRTRDVADYLQYTLQSMDVREGMTVIDAGCGVCGPACYFAKQINDLKIHAVTVSDYQVQLAQQKIGEQGLAERVEVKQGDYQQLDKLYPEEFADRVFFLESFGHSNDKEQAILSAYRVLKPGGKLYIKDLFLRESNNEWEQQRINDIATQINLAYQYQICDLHQVVSAIRRAGFLIDFIRPPQVERDKFEHLTISNDFQNLFNIGKIESWDDYVFPVDFFEIRATKPEFNPSRDIHLYFMNRQDATQVVE